MRRLLVLVAIGCTPNANPAPTGKPLVVKIDAVRPPKPANVKPESIVEIMASELARNMIELSKRDMPAYFASYRVIEDHDQTIASEPSDSYDQHRRDVEIEVRVGTYERDQTSRDRFAFDFAASEMLPIDDDELAIRTRLWHETDLLYKKAVETYNNGVEPPKTAPPDFSRAPAVESYASIAASPIDRTAWQARVRDLAKRLEHPRIARKWVAFHREHAVTYYASSEGTRLQQARVRDVLIVRAFVDGDWQLHQIALDGPMTDAELRGRVDQFAALIVQPRLVIEEYDGPVLFEDASAGVVFHEAFTTPMVTKVVGMQAKVLPEHLDVYDDPTIERLNGRRLAGHYYFDDEGVAATKVELVKHGLLVGMLSNRTRMSTGHGRRRLLHRPATSIGNLVVASTAATDRVNLRRLLLDGARQRGHAYGIVVREVQFSSALLTDERVTLTPTLVYRVFADGREERVDATFEAPRADLGILAAGAALATANRPIDPVLSVSAPPLLVDGLRAKPVVKPFYPPPPPTSHDPIKDELKRAITELVPKPAHLAYSAMTGDEVSATAELGALVRSSATSVRWVDVALRIGDNAFGIGHVFTTDRDELWRATNRAYEEAQHKPLAAPTAPSLIDVKTVALPDRARIEALAKKLSAIFRGNPDVYVSRVQIVANGGKHRFVASDGADSNRTVSEVTIEVSCETQAADGDTIAHAKRWRVASMDKLPSDSDLVANVERISKKLSNLRTAKPMAIYRGPVIVDGVAAPQLLRELLGEDPVIAKLGKPTLSDKALRARAFTMTKAKFIFLVARGYPDVVVAKKLYRDGREELVRSASIPVGPSQDQVVALGTRPHTDFINGRSIAAPAMLLSNVDIERKTTGWPPETPPVVSRPQLRQ